MRWTLKRYVINNRAIKFGGRRSSDENECYFAADVPLGRPTMYFTDSADERWFPPLHLSTSPPGDRKIAQLFYFQVHTNNMCR